MVYKGNSTESSSAPSAKWKLSRGWVTVIAGAFIIFIAGNFQYSFGAFVKPLVNNFGWSRTAISVGVTIRSIISGLTSPLAGALGDRYGFRKFILIGIVLVGLGYLLTSRLNSLWQLYLFLGLMTGMGVSSFFVPIIGTATKWFGSKSALANGIILSGFSWAQIITPPTATYLILRYGWETCFVVLGLAALVLGTLAWLFIRTPPDAAKQPAEQIQVEESNDGEARAASEYDYTLAEAVRTPALWILFLILIVVAASYQLVAIHIIAAAIDTGIAPQAAAIILTISGITNTAGRLALGGLATILGNKKVLVISIAIQAVTLFFLAGTRDLYVLYFVAAVYGLGYGGVTPITATLTGSFFGTKSIGSIFGTVNSAYTLGGAIGPLLGGYIYDATGSYYIAFLTAAIATASIFILCLAVKPPRKKLHAG